MKVRLQCQVVLVTSLLLSPLPSLKQSRHHATDFLPKTAWSLTGYPAYLGCEIEPENPREQLYTVLWYKDDDGEPLYTYDARASGLLSPKHWSEEEPRGFGSRARFVVSPHPAQLVVNNVKAEDAGQYRCRVDFKSSQTRNSLVTLSIISPPTRAVITYLGQEVRGAVGPVTEGATVSLTCVSSGSPAPSTAWYRDGVLVDATSEVMGSEVSNIINIHNVSHRETLASFTCRASNNNQTRPVESSVRIRVNFPPLDVKIVGLPGSVVAGKAQKARCVSVGSRPAASLTWWKDGQFLGRPTEVFSSHSGVTSSELDIIPTSQDHAKSVVCRAENPHIPGVTLETTRVLDVKFPPKVRLQWGANIDGENIAEGQDIYLECLSVANPPVSRTVWLHDNYRVEPSKTDGIVISGHSLVIQSLTPRHSGNYSCVTSNTQGDAVSQTLQLMVRFRPLCVLPDLQPVRLPLNVQAEVLCKVRSHPPPSFWWWTFNNSHQLDQVSQSKYQSNLTESRLRYSPLSLQDYGVLNCWARNDQGESVAPCRYQLLQASQSSHRLQCSLHNQTGHSLLVLCSGAPGQVPGGQVYHLEVRDKSSGELVQNITSDRPRFLVTDLPPVNWLAGLNLTVYTASKETGTINTVETLGVSTSKVAELQHESVVEGQEEDLDTVRVSLGIISGVAVTVTCLLSGLLYPCVRILLGRRREEEQEEELPVPTHQGLVTVYDKVDLLLPAQYSDSSLDTTSTITLTDKELGQSRRSASRSSKQRDERESIL